MSFVIRSRCFVFFVLIDLYSSFGPLRCMYMYLSRLAVRVPLYIHVYMHLYMYANVIK